MGTAKKRSKWWVRLLGLAGLLVVGVIVAWGVWGAREKRALWREVESLRSKGEPVWLSDFATTPVPDEQNAAIELEIAAKGISDNPAWKAFNELSHELGLPLTKEEEKALRQGVAASQESFKHVALATTRPGVDWKIKMVSPTVDILLPHLNDQHDLRDALACDALLAHQDHDDARALLRVEQVLFISRALDKQVIGVSHLVSMGAGAVAAENSQSMAADLMIGDQPGAARPGHVKKLIDLLLDETACRKGQRDALIFDRAQNVDVVLSSLNGTAKDAQGNPKSSALNRAFSAPTFLADARRWNTCLTRLIEAIETSQDLPALMRAFTFDSKEAAQGARRNWIADLLLPVIQGSIAAHYRVLAERRLAATALAVRWYAVEHQGTLPAKLEDLVPRYLPAVPMDPLADGRPLGYVPRGDRPVVYSVGKDGVDHGGSTRPTGRVGETEDRVVDLKRQTRVIETDGVEQN